MLDVTVKINNKRYRFLTKILGDKTGFRKNGQHVNVPKINIETLKNNVISDVKNTKVI